MENLSHETTVNAKSDPLPTSLHFGLNKKIAAASFGLGLIFNYLFYNHQTGIAYPLFVLIFYAVIYKLNIPGKLFSVKPDWLHFGIVILLSLTFAIFSNPVLSALNKLVIPLIIISQLCILNSPGRKFSDLFIIKLISRLILKAFTHILPAFKAFGNLFSFGIIKNPIAKKVITGIVIALPLFVVLLTLLSEADEIFSKQLFYYTNLLADLKIDNLIGRGLNIGFIALGISLIVLSAVYFNHAKGSYKLNIHWDSITVNTVLILINLLFLIFCIIQLNFLFLGNDNLPTGFDYSHYARKGFFELCTVAVINFIILISTLYCTKQNEQSKKTFLQIQLSTLIILTTVLLISAFYRMYLYESSFGFTYLRFFTHVFMVMLFVLLAASMIRIYNHQLDLRRYFITTGLLFYIILNYCNPDLIIAKLNINKFSQTEKLDVYYLISLSDDAFPALQEFCLDNNNSKSDIEQISDRLYKKKCQKLQNIQKSSWQEFNWGKYHAGTLIQPGI